MVAENKRGVIVNISSGSAVGLSGLSLYGATKGGINSFTSAIAKEHPDLISVCAFNPGHVDTRLQADIRQTDPSKFPSSKTWTELHSRGELINPLDSDEQIFFLTNNPQLFQCGSMVDYNFVVKTMLTDSKSDGQASELKPAGCEVHGPDPADSTRSAQENLKSVLDYSIDHE
jgi:NAD(P)-dependent dehydrogenase (short-subunit alcohol dehydrogenase family)